MKKLIILCLLLILICFAFVGCTGTINCKMVSSSAEAQYSQSGLTAHLTFIVRLKYKEKYFTIATSDHLYVSYSIDGKEDTDAYLYGNALTRSYDPNLSGYIFGSNVFEPKSFVYFKVSYSCPYDNRNKSIPIVVKVYSKNKGIIDEYRFSLKHKD